LRRDSAAIAGQGEAIAIGVAFSLPQPAARLDSNMAEVLSQCVTIRPLDNLAAFGAALMQVRWVDAVRVLAPVANGPIWPGE